MAENFPNLGSKKGQRNEKAQMTPNRINPKQITLRLIKIKFSKSRTRGILKVAIENLLIICKRTPIRLSASFFAKPHSPGESVWYIQNTERKKKNSTKNTLPRNNNLFKERDNVFPRQITTEGIHHH